MLKKLSNLGQILSKNEESSINGGNVGAFCPGWCPSGTFRCNCSGGSFCASSVSICLNICGTALE